MKEKLSAKRRRTKREQKLREKQEENQGKPRIKAKNKESAYLSWVSSHIKGKFMNLQCFSIMFDTSYACYDKLGQGLWVIKAW